MPEFELVYEAGSDMIGAVDTDAAARNSSDTFPRGIWNLSGDALFNDGTSERKHSSTEMHLHSAVDS